jgi:hypothetical protein
MWKWVKGEKLLGDEAIIDKLGQVGASEKQATGSYFVVFKGKADASGSKMTGRFTNYAEGRKESDRTYTVKTLTQNQLVVEDETGKTGEYKK